MGVTRGTFDISNALSATGAATAALGGVVGFARTWKDSPSIPAPRIIFGDHLCPLVKFIFIDLILIDAGFDRG
jgi:hypothetical protein